MDHAVPAFLVLTLIPLTYSITNGIMFGLATAAAFYVTTGRAFTDLMRFIKRTEAHDEGVQAAIVRNNNRESEVSVFSERPSQYGAV